MPNYARLTLERIHCIIPPTTYTRETEPTMTEEEYLTTAQVAERLNVGIRTVEKFARSGEIPGAFKIGNWIWRFPASEIQKYIERQQAEAVKERVL